MNTLMEQQQQFLKDLAENMKNQDNRATQYPLFYVYEKEDRWVDPDDSYDKLLWYDDGQCETTETFTDKDDNEWVWDIEKEIWRCESLDKEYDADYFEIEVAPELRKVYVKEVDKPVIDVGPFLTETAAKAHIEANLHHYDRPFIYVNSSWRNYEMQNILKIIFELAGVETPSCYK